MVRLSAAKTQAAGSVACSSIVERGNRWSDIRNYLIIPLVRYARPDVASHCVAIVIILVLPFFEDSMYYPCSIA